MKNKIQLGVLLVLAIVILIVSPLIPKAKSESSNETPEKLTAIHTLVLNEVVTKNKSILADEDGDYSDYIEIYNSGEAPIPMKGYGLSDDPSVPLKWTFPDIILEPHAYLVVFASEKNKVTSELHTSFKLNENGDKLALSDSAGVLIQTLALADSINNMSYSLDLNGNYIFYTTGTPGAENQGTVIDDLMAYKKDYIITFSEAAGFYTAPIDVSLSVSNPDVNIRYTIDGTDPLANSSVFEAPITIASRTGDPNVYANIQSTFDKGYVPSAKDVFKGTVLKAQAFLGDVPMGEIVTNTYFVDELGAERYTLPVVSLTTDPYNFFDDEFGIYVFGSKFRESAPPNVDGTTPANYNQRGREWERPIHLEYFNLDGLCVFEQSLGIRTMGGWSRANSKKSFKLFSRECYQEDASSMDYPFFKNLESMDGTPIESFSRLALRSGGNDWEIALFRDPFMQDLVSDTLDSQAAKPVILFLNGEYWGIYFLNESLDEYYVESHYGIAKEDVSIMSYSTSLEVYVGVEDDMTYYKNMIKFIEDNDLSLQENYDHMNTLIDMDNFIEYYVSQIYFCNTDWPANNVKFWRKRTDSYEPNAPYGQDGRYRFMLYDTDFGFTLYEGLSNPMHKTLEFATAEDGPQWPNPEWSTLIFRSLLKNESFKQKFINVLADNLNTRFAYTTVNTHIDYYMNLLKPEIEEYSKRYQMWAMPDEKTWEDNSINVIRTFAKKRPDYLRLDALSYFKLEGAFDVSLSLNDPASGAIRVNNHMDVLNDAAIPTFTGMYFTNMPITLEAKPKKGYHFTGWSGDVQGSDAMLELTSTKDMKIIANFERD